MKQITVKLLPPVIIALLLFTSLFLRPLRVSAGVSEWTAETIPSTLDNLLAPSGGGNSTDIRDYTIGDDEATIFAVPGDSITTNTIYKSINAGVTWTSQTTTFQAVLIAMAPDNNNIVAAADNTSKIFLSIDGGVIWSPLDKPPDAVAILDIAISRARNGVHYIAAAGWEAGNIANVWYYAYGEFASWQKTNGRAGFISDNETAAIAFSPGFEGDATLAAVTDNAGTGVNLQLFNFTSLKWNAAASYEGYPCTVVAANVATLASASLALSPNYNGFDDDYQNLFVGLTINGDAAAIAASGIYRFLNTAKASILTDKQVHSVAFNGSFLVAGLYNGTTVYRVLNPLSSSWTVKTSTATKEPGGENRVLVAWMGTTVTAGTAGNESAFSISKDTGTTFNDISLIDTTITNARDIAVSASGTKAYFVTDDGLDTSVWYGSFSTTGGVSKTTWTRAFNIKGTFDYIIRVERQSANAVYLAQKGGTTIYYNSSSGAAQWQSRVCSVNIQDMAIESTQLIYALGNTGQVSKSANAGIFWSVPVDTNLTSGGMLTMISAGKLLAGSLNGFIAYSMDSSATWTLIPRAFNAAAGRMQVIPDQNFATNKTIYAASVTNGQDIKKWQIDTSTDWIDIFPGTITGGVYGLGIDSNTLYAIEYNGMTNQSTLWRFIAPTNATAASNDWIPISTTNTTDITDPNVAFTAAPQALKTSTSKLWAIKTNLTNKLYSFGDSVTDITITLNLPEDEGVININAFTGIAKDIGFQWKRPSTATEYELKISMDPDFSSAVASIPVTSLEDPVFVLVGPGQPLIRKVNFMPGTTYYWKIRTTKPGFSLYSNYRSFSIEPIVTSNTLGIQILTPINSQTTMDTTPAFSWQPLAGATEYEFMLSDSMSISSPLLDTTVNSTGFQLTQYLERGKTYFWQVRAISPVMSDWSGLGNFRVGEFISPIITEKAPPITLELPATTQTQLVFPPPAETPTFITPVYIMIAIFILLALATLVILLIFNRSR